MADEHGNKTSAGMMLSKFLKEIGAETSQVAGRDETTGEPRVVTKAEALARTIWKMALGFEEQIKVTDTKTGKPKLVTKKHKPEMSCINMIFDRLEGKVSVSSEDDGYRKTKALKGRVSDQIKRRLNAKTE